MSDAYGNTALMRAASANAYVLVLTLLNSGAEATCKNNFGWNALKFAVKYNAHECVTILSKMEGMNLANVGGVEETKNALDIV